MNTSCTKVDVVVAGRVVGVVQDLSLYGVGYRAAVYGLLKRAYPGRGVRDFDTFAQAQAYVEQTYLAHFIAL